MSSSQMFKVALNAWFRFIIRKSTIPDALAKQRNATRKSKSMHNLRSQGSVDILSTPSNEAFLLLLDDMRAAAAP